MIKTLALIIIGLTAFTVNAQFNIQVNGKSISNNEEIKYDENLKTISISFSNAKKIPEYTTGKVEFLVKAVDQNGENIFTWMIKKEGYSALSDFLYPAKPINYTLANADDALTEFGITGTNFNHVCSTNVDNLDAKVMTVHVSLNFYEKLTYNSYGSPIKLVDDMIFTVDIWKNSTTIAFKSLNAKLNFSAVPEFEEILPPNNNLTDYKNQTDAAGFGTREVIKIKFKGDDAYLHIVQLDGKNQDEAIKELTTSFENYLRVIANGCNTKEIKASLQPLDNRDWEKLTGFTKQNTDAVSTDQKRQRIYAPLDQMNNKAYADVKVFESVSAGKLQGFRFKGLIHQSSCVMRSFMLGEGGKEAARSEPSANFVVGDDIIYFLKHPTNAGQIIILNIPTNNTDATDANLELKAKLYDNFLANLAFN